VRRGRRSSTGSLFDHFVELLDAGELADGWTTKDDVEASKPEPDLVRPAASPNRN
jgi:beta-phosphoglucomutase-like phosphatase (HAD superfamily)